MMNIPLVPQTTRELDISGIALLLVDSQYGRNRTSRMGASHAATKNGFYSILKAIQLNDFKRHGPQRSNLLLIKFSYIFLMSTIKCKEKEA